LCFEVVGCASAFGYTVISVTFGGPLYLVCVRMVFRMIWRASGLASKNSCHSSSETVVFGIQPNWEFLPKKMRSTQDP